MSYSGRPDGLPLDSGRKLDGLSIKFERNVNDRAECLRETYAGLATTGVRFNVSWTQNRYVTTSE